MNVEIKLTEECDCCKVVRTVKTLKYSGERIEFPVIDARYESNLERVFGFDLCSECVSRFDANRNLQYLIHKEIFGYDPREL